MWSKNGIPVRMKDFPVPSILSLTLMAVSVVTRVIWACRFLIATGLNQSNLRKTKPNPEGLAVNSLKVDPQSTHYPHMQKTPGMELYKLKLQCQLLLFVV